MTVATPWRVTGRAGRRSAAALPLLPHGLRVTVNQAVGGSGGRAGRLHSSM